MQELKDELQARALDTSGLKAVLVERLEEAVGAEETGEPNGAAAEPAEAAAPADAAAEAGSAEAAAAKPAEQVGCVGLGGGETLHSCEQQPFMHHATAPMARWVTWHQNAWCMHAGWWRGSAGRSHCGNGAGAAISRGHQCRGAD